MSIEGIYISPKASMPMQSIQNGLLIEGKGLDGDRYCKHIGTYSVLRKSKIKPGECELGRQLTLISADSIENVIKQNIDKLDISLKDFNIGNLRRNIVIRGLSSNELLSSIGHVIKLGPICRILVHRHTVPCMYNEGKNNIKGLMEVIWYESGISCEVLVGGPIHINDIVEIEDNNNNNNNVYNDNKQQQSSSYQIDNGDHPSGYYIPPSKRTLDMVKEAIEMKRNLKEKYNQIDPDGVKRIEQSYCSVGLTFWPKDKKEEK